MRGLALRRTAGLATFLTVCFLLGSALLAPGARAGGADVQIDFAAAAPLSYDHSIGGGAWNDKTIGRDADVVESLEGGDFACGDVVTYLVEVVVDGAASPGTRTLGMAFTFLADSTGQSGVGHVDVIRALVNYGVGDTGIADDGGSAVSIVDEEMVGTPFTKGAELHLELRLTDLEPGERVIVRIDTRLGCDYASRPTGNLQGAATSAWIEGGDAVPIGEQTVPFKEVNRILFPTLGVVKTADPASHPEPGGVSTFSVTVINTGEVPLTLVDLVDSIHGDLDARGTCKVPQTLPAAPEGVYRCAFSASVAGPPGYSETDVVTAVARDETGREVRASDDAVVVILPVPSSIEVLKVAAPETLPAPGGQVTFSVTVRNLSAVDRVTINSLVDSIHGNLDGRGTCAVPFTLEPGGVETAGDTYGCSFTASVGGSGGYVETDVVTASGVDDDQQPVSDSDDATVRITSLPATTTTSAPKPLLGSIGDFVWFDADGDGIQDPTESGVPGATVRLLGSDGGLLATAMTGSGGTYLFTGLAAGRYVVEFVLPDVPGYSSEAFTLAGAGADDRDSDAATTTGRTVEIGLAPGENDPTWDAGVIGAAVLAAQVEPTTTTVAAVTLPFTGTAGRGPGVLGVWMLAVGLCVLAITRREEPATR